MIRSVVDPIPDADVEGECEEAEVSDAEPEREDTPVRVENRSVCQKTSVGRCRWG